MILSRFITIWNDKEFDMDKRDYELLLALDQHKNITKAAQSLYMTQPAITKRIQKMEEELHCPSAACSSPRQPKACCHAPARS